MKFLCEGEYLGKNSRAVGDKVYYNVSVLQDVESVQFGCSAEVFSALDNANRGDPVQLVFTESVRSGRSGAFVSRYCSAVEFIV